MASIALYQISLNRRTLFIFFVIIRSFRCNFLKKFYSTSQRNENKNLNLFKQLSINIMQQNNYNKDYLEKDTFEIQFFVLVKVNNKIINL